MDQPNNEIHESWYSTNIGETIDTSNMIIDVVKVKFLKQQKYISLKGLPQYVAIFIQFYNLG